MWTATEYPSTGTVLTLEHYHTALDEFLQSRARMFRSRWVQTTAAEAKILTAMASLGDHTRFRRFHPRGHRRLILRAAASRINLDGGAMKIGSSATPRAGGFPAIHSFRQPSAVTPDQTVCGRQGIVFECIRRNPNARCEFSDRKVLRRGHKAKV